MALPFEMQDLLRLISANMAHTLTPFGLMMLQLDLRELQDRNYLIQELDNHVKIYNPDKIVVGESRQLEGDIYLITINGKSAKFDTEHDRWLSDPDFDLNVPNLSSYRLIESIIIIILLIILVLIIWYS